MKTILTLLAGLAAASLAAQNNPLVPPPPPVPESPAELVPHPAAPSAANSSSRPGKPVKQKADVKITTSSAGASANEALRVAERAAIISAKRDRLELESGLPRSTRTGRTLVIQTSEPDPDAIADAEEDMSVMALILRKATGGSTADEKRLALGIEVDSAVFGSSSGARNILVEGHGALFLLSVPFPLIGPSDQTQETKLQDAPESEWAQAREEFLNAERTRYEVQFDRVWAGPGRPYTEEYDAGKVEELKTALLESLKNASHIRALKPDNYVTVVIQGAEVARADRAAGRKNNRSDSRRGETVMTIRVKKADVDAFGRGALDLAGFRQKAAVQTYFRRGDASVGTSPFFGPPAK